MKNNILYIDDESENLKSFKFLYQRNFNVLLAQSTYEAEKILELQEVKVVITDQRMPNETGLEFIKRNKNKYPDIIYIILTGYTDIDIIYEAINTEGIYKYLNKPFDTKEMTISLIHAIDKYNVDMENRRLLVELENANTLLAHKNNELQIQNAILNRYSNKLKKTNVDLQQSKKKAQESDQLKTAFLNNMSHEIRTPMNGIIGFSQMLLKPNKTEEQKKVFIDIIVRSSRQLLNIVNDILDIAKIEVGEVKIKEEATNLYDFISYIITVNQAEAQNKNIKLINCCKVCLQRNVFVDLQKLTQILNNLISNALKFTKQGTIQLKCCIEQDVIEFSVADTGIGIKKELYDRIFDRFWQAEFAGTRNYGGTGLGLSICKGLVKIMNGKIWLKSKLGKGTTFTFTIPYKPVIKTEEPKIASKAEVRKDYSNITFLVVEDEENNYLYIEEILTDLNAKTIHAKNGLEAVEYIKTNKKVDLVLMDIKMPIMNGYDATIEIKQLRPELSIIALTAHAFTNEKEEILNAGCDDYLAKPINEELLIEHIDRQLMKINS